MRRILLRVPDLRGDGARLPVGIGIARPAEESLRGAHQPIPAPVQGEAMIDIGAGRSLIQEGVAEQLGLKPTGSVEIDTPSSIDLTAYEFPVRFYLPESVVIELVALEAPLPGHGLQALLGRDLLTDARFEYRGARNEFLLEFA